MRILLQSFETGLYLDPSEHWTNTSDLARNFPNTRQAAQFKIHRRLANTFVVVQPDPVLPANLTGTLDGPIMHTQEPAMPAGCRVKAIQAEMLRQGRSAQGKSAMPRRPKGSDRHPCNLSP